MREIAETRSSFFVWPFDFCDPAELVYFHNNIELKPKTIGFQSSWAHAMFPLITNMKK